MRQRTLIPLLLLVAACWIPRAHAQSAESEAEECTADQELTLSDTSSLMNAGASSSTSSDNLTPAEQRVQDLIAQDGVHVIHFWAPWCDNSRNEFANGWFGVVERHADVTFAFVTVRNGGELGQPVLDKYAIPDRVTTLAHPSARPREQFTFLDLPITWIPTTWIFHQHGELAFAMNYGEMDMDTLDRLIQMTKQDW